MKLGFARVKTFWALKAATRFTKEETKMILDENSIHPLLLIICYPLFVFITPYFEFYLLFDVDPMRFVHFGVSRMIKNVSLIYFSLISYVFGIETPPGHT